MLPGRPSCPYRVDVGLWNDGPRQGLSVTLWNSQKARSSGFYWHRATGFYWHRAIGWAGGISRASVAPRALREHMSSAVRSVLREAPDPADLDLLEGQLSDPASLFALLSVMGS